MSKTLVLSVVCGLFLLSTQVQTKPPAEGHLEIRVEDELAHRFDVTMAFYKDVGTWKYVFITARSEGVKSNSINLPSAQIVVALRSNVREGEWRPVNPVEVYGFLLGAKVLRTWKCVDEPLSLVMNGNSLELSGEVKLVPLFSRESRDSQKKDAITHLAIKHVAAKQDQELEKMLFDPVLMSYAPGMLDWEDSMLRPPEN